MRAIALSAVLLMGMNVAVAGLKPVAPKNVNLTGLWQINLELSDDPQQIVDKKREASGGRRGRGMGGPGGRGGMGGGWGGMGGGGRGTWGGGGGDDESSGPGGRSGNGRSGGHHGGGSRDDTDEDRGEGPCTSGSTRTGTDEDGGNAGSTGTGGSGSNAGSTGTGGSGSNAGSGSGGSGGNADSSTGGPGGNAGSGSGGANGSTRAGTDDSGGNNCHRLPLDDMLVTQEQLDIKQDASVMTFASVEQTSSCKAGEAAQVSMPDGNMADRQCGWKSKKFIVEVKSPKGLTRTDQYELAKDGKQLIVVTEIKGGHGPMKDLTIKRTYDRTLI